MPSKYVTTLIKITNHVSQPPPANNLMQSCVLVSELHKNMTTNLCYSIDCKQCAFAQKNHNKIILIDNKDT